MGNDGLAYVKEPSMNTCYDGSADPAQPKYQMSKGLVDIPDELLNDTIEAADECPGECIFIDEA